MPQRKCAIKTCGKGFFSSQPRARFCSKECGQVYIKALYGRVRTVKIPSSTTGAASELVAAAWLMRKGWDVFRALSPSSDCDLLAEHRTEKKQVRLEVRTGYRNVISGKIMVPRERIEGKALIIVIWGENGPDFVVEGTTF